MKVIYMGTPDFACAPLKAIIEAGHEVAAVFCQPDRPKGRGMKMLAPPVKELALQYNIPVYQPETFRNHAALPILEDVQPDVIVVAAYGRILPPYVLKAPKYGCINIHASLLPKYRGAAPIQRVIIDGGDETGVTIMHMAKELDAGDMILTGKTTIDPVETAGELTMRLSKMGAELILTALTQLENGTAQRTPQNEDEVCYASMISRADARLDFSQSARALCDRARAMQPAPGAFTEAEGQVYKFPVLRASDEVTDAPCGTVLGLDKDGNLRIACEGGMVLAPEIQAPSSKRMPCAAYARGHALPEKFD